MTKNKFIIIRISEDIKQKLVKLAGGDRKLSRFVRAILEDKTK